VFPWERRQKEILGGGLFPWMAGMACEHGVNQEPCMVSARIYEPSKWLAHTKWYSIRSIILAHGDGLAAWIVLP